MQWKQMFTKNVTLCKNDKKKQQKSMQLKRDDLSFTIINFPFLRRSIPLAPAYGMYVSQLVHYARAFFKQQDSVDRGKLLIN